MVKKSIKKPFKKTVVFRSGLGRDFLGFLPSYTPKWCQNGARRVPKSIQKPLLVEKAGFRFDVGKQIV